MCAVRTWTIRSLLPASRQSVISDNAKNQFGSTGNFGESSTNLAPIAPLRIQAVHVQHVYLNLPHSFHGEVMVPRLACSSAAHLSSSVHQSHPLGFMAAAWLFHSANSARELLSTWQMVAFAGQERWLEVVQKATSCAAKWSQLSYRATHIVRRHTKIVQPSARNCPEFKETAIDSSTRLQSCLYRPPVDQVATLTQNHCCSFSRAEAGSLSLSDSLPLCLSPPPWHQPRGLRLRLRPLRAHVLLNS